MIESSKKLSPPIIIVAPIQRCGTTLVQRAINSSGNTIIYGENFLFAESMPLLVGTWQRNEHAASHGVNLFRDRISKGDFDQDMSGLLPKFESISQLTKKQFFEYFYLYNNDALSMNFDRWGFKHQINNLSGFLHFYNLATTARYIFMYRDILDVLRSYKARFGLEGANQAAALAGKWKRHVSAMRSLEGSNILHMQLKDLEQNPENSARNIERHCGIDSISIDVFSRKINVSDIIDNLNDVEMQTKYKQPLELTSSELSAVLHEVGDIRAEFGYR